MSDLVQLDKLRPRLGGTGLFNSECPESGLGARVPDSFLFSGYIGELAVWLILLLFSLWELPSL